jgi:hypothetical protein
MSLGAVLTAESEELYQLLKVAYPRTGDGNAHWCQLNPKYRLTPNTARGLNPWLIAKVLYKRTE